MRCRAFGGRFTVLHQCDTDVTGAGIAAVRLRTRQIGAGDDAHAALLDKFYGRGFVAAMRRDVEPEAEAAGRTLVAETVALRIWSARSNLMR
jgi:hypothetical protein